MVRFSGGNAAEATEGKVRHWAYLLMISGIVIVMLGYGRLLIQAPEASGTVPVIIAFLGFVVSTLGYFSFVGYEKRTRLTYSLRSPVFDVEEDDSRTPASDVDGSQSTRRMRRPHAAATFYRRVDYLNRN